MQGVIQLAHCILQNGLCLDSSAAQHCKLVVQHLLPQPLLLRLLRAKRRNLQTLQGLAPGTDSGRLVKAS